MYAFESGWRLSTAVSADKFMAASNFPPRARRARLKP
jgi:hypothetical protein